MVDETAEAMPIDPEYPALSDDKIERIAALAHEVNRLYCSLFMNDKSHEPWETAPEWQRESARNGVKFQAEKKKFRNYRSNEESHNNWLTEKLKDGWTYGKTKDAEKKQHPCLLPYDKLPLNQKVKDSLFTAVVTRLISAERGILIGD